MAPATLALVEKGEAKKGDVLATARIAGIMAAKKTHELIPLCHPLAITKATVDFEPSHDPAGIRVTAEVKVAGQTGVEMEALTAVSVACLTIYDMLKAADKAMTLGDIRLIEKTGGRSGTYRAADSKGSDSHGRAPLGRRSPAPHPRWRRADAGRDRRHRGGAPAHAGRAARRARSRSRRSMPPPWTAMPCAPPMSPACRRRSP